MKAISLIITSVFLFSLGTGVLAQGTPEPEQSTVRGETELPDPGLTPDSPFYFLERVTEAIGTFFTFGDVKKAERRAVLATERLAEVKAVVEKGKSELAEKTLERYKVQLQNSIASAEKAQAKGENTEEVMIRIGQATSKHLEVLAEVYEKVPEQAKSAIENAMKVSVKGHEKAAEVLKEQNALRDVPEKISLPESIPQKVRENIQTKVQQELEIEKALEGIDTSKSLRDICAEQGGTPEMCEQFPPEKFKSFEQIEDYCTGLGGPPEICTTLEAKCGEFGVTEANECFILLSVSSIKTYQSVELKTVPAPSLSEEERKIQRETQGEIQEVSRKIEEGVSSNLGGIGVEIGIKNGQLTVLGFTGGSSAEKAGLRIGDKILAINGENAVGVAVVDAVKKISGEIGTNVILLISRNDEEGVKNISIIRTLIK